jgi:protein-L-isoaspartate(D-aspartate) O-methyltransferase
MADAARAREEMIVSQLEARGITDARVLEAMRHVPREHFATPESAGSAYADSPLPIGEGQTMSQPYIVALMAQAAAIRPTDRVLEVGAGSGYAAAVLGRLAARVWTLERRPRLARLAGARLAELGQSNVTVLRADGTLGWPAAAPFDAILVTASGPRIPEPLRRQLARGGRLVMPLGETGATQRLVRVTRTPEDTFEEEDLGGVAFVPLIGEHGHPEES